MNKALAVLMLVVTVAGSQEPMPPRPSPDVGLTVPEKLKCAIHEPIVIRATTTGKRVKWVVPAALTKCVREYDSGRELAVWAAPGVYEILCLSAVGDEPLMARCELTVGGGVVPPVPPPDPPCPNDPLAPELKRLFDADTHPEKVKHAAQLAALYRQAVKLAEDPTIVTAGQFLSRVQEASKLLLSADALVGVRKRIAAELQANLSTNAESPMTAERRLVKAAMFRRLAEVMGCLR